MKTEVNRHNTRLLRSNVREEVDPCPHIIIDCPMPGTGECTKTNAIYQCTVTSDDSVETYIGATTDFKQRYYNHRTNSINVNYKTKTTLSAHIWKLKDENKNFNVAWRIIDRAPPYNSITKQCRLCLKEAWYITFKPHLASLNKRTEMFNTCRHRLKHILAKA